MSIDILDSMSRIFGGQITQQVSTLLGDSEEGTRSALRSGMSALLAGVMQKSADPNGASELFRTVTSDRSDASLDTKLPNILNNRASLDSTLAAGESLVGSVFGNRTGGVAHAVSQVAGIKPASATGLLAIAAPMLFGLLKRLTTQGGLDARGLGSLLLDQRAALQKSGLDSRITSALGYGSLPNMLGSIPDRARERVAEATAYAGSRSVPREAYIPAHSRKRSWIPWAVAATLGVLALAFLANRFASDRGTRTASLPARVYFNEGQAAVDADDRRTIATVASSVKGSGTPVAVTGYTDRSGDADQNLALARNRATAVRDALVAEGLPESSIVMAPPSVITGTGSANEARRVDISLAEADTAIRR